MRHRVLLCLPEAKYSAAPAYGSSTLATLARSKGTAMCSAVELTSNYSAAPSCQPSAIWGRHAISQSNGARSISSSAPCSVSSFTMWIDCFLATLRPPVPNGQHSHFVNTTHVTPTTENLSGQLAGCQCVRQTTYSVVCGLQLEPLHETGTLIHSLVVQSH